METGEVRKRLRAAIDRARNQATARRASADAARHAYDRFLSKVAVPVFEKFAAALRGEGQSYRTLTPADSVRLIAERSSDDYIEMELDTMGTQPLVVGRVSRSRGSRVIREERPLHAGVAIEKLTEEDVLEFLLAEIGPFLER